MSNQLKDQKSPYLLQHAENPVCWYPWCSGAFETAQREDKPVFLSIGYSTCHWCHVMAHESFEDEEIARILNRSFVSIKVDREERPDIDAVYLSVCQAMTGSGGWPLTILMTPDQKPFYAGTYLAKHSCHGRTGLFELLQQTERLWNGQKARLFHAGEETVAWLTTLREPAATEPSRELIRRGVSELARNFDPQWGGFGPAPKFPTPHNLLFLMYYAALEQDRHAMHMAVRTLKGMSRGGIYDHIGGGFSRYSTDEKWLIPHFEKMLYDNALLIYTFAAACQMTKDPCFLQVIKETVSYVLRELKDEKGGFFCGQDADSDGIEGKYYALTPEEVCTLLGKEDGEDFCRFFGITEEGNFEGKNIPNCLEQDGLKDERIERLCRKLDTYRHIRTRLHKDDKILTAWNSLMIAALAKASFLFREPCWFDAARNAQYFLKAYLTDPRGRLYVRYRDGEAAGTGNLEDYAYQAWALLELYQVTWNVAYLSEAVRLSEQMIRWFQDTAHGGFYLYASDAEQLISRPKETWDGALPSGNSVAALVFSLLFSLTGEEIWHTELTQLLNYLAGVSGSYPSGHGFTLFAMCNVVYPSSQLLCVSSENRMPKDAEEELRRNFFPGLTVLLLTSENRDCLIRMAPFAARYPIPDEGTVYYLCRGNTCSAPTRDLPTLLAPLRVSWETLL